MGNNTRCLSGHRSLSNMTARSRTVWTGCKAGVMPRTIEDYDYIIACAEAATRALNPAIAAMPAAPTSCG